MRLVTCSLLSLVLLACDSDNKRPLGSSCVEAAECESNLCVSSMCIEPYSCGEAMAFWDPPELAAACFAGLRELEVSVSDPNPVAGQTIRFTATGVFGEPVQPVGTDPNTGDPNEADPNTGEPNVGEPNVGGAGTVQRADLTGWVGWSAYDFVEFSPEETGVATIAEGAVGSVVVTASVVSKEGSARAVTGYTSVEVLGDPTPNR